MVLGSLFGDLSPSHQKSDRLINLHPSNHKRYEFLVVSCIKIHVLNYASI